jgi:hypothetical protein
VQWFTNDIAVATATNSTFVLPTLPNGSNHVRAIVHDGTDWVKNDSTQSLRQIVSWSVQVGPQLSLDSAQWLTGGAFAFRVHGVASGPVTVQGSTNLSNWIPLETNTLSGGEFWHTNAGPTVHPARFFRAVTQP